MTANLQTGLTVRQAAEVMNVSERSCYTAGRILREGSPELIADVEAGRVSLHAALRLIAPPPSPRAGAALIKAWQRASDDDRLALADWIQAARPSD